MAYFVLCLRAVSFTDTHTSLYTPDMTTVCTCHVVSPVVPWEMSCVDSFIVTYPQTPCTEILV